MTVLAVDLGGSKILAALVDGPRVLDRAEAATDRAAGPAAWLAQVAALARPWAGRFRCAGLTVTGLVRDGHWSAMNPAILNVPQQFALAHEAGAALGMAVTLANDAQAAAWGEHVHGAGRGQGDMVFLTVSTGIGGGVIANRALLTGRSGMAGHVGQLLPMQINGGRFEDSASGRWIAAEAEAQGQPGDARAVFAAAARGAGWAEAIIDGSAQKVARLARNLQLLFDPSLIVVGGGIGLAPGYLERLRAALADLEDHYRPTLERAALGADAGAIGIAALTIPHTS